MDESQFSPTNKAPATANKLKKILFFTEIGFFEIGFVVIVLGIFLFALQYFKVIDLTKTFPGLSLLSHIGAPQPLKPLTLSDLNTFSENYIKATVNPDNLPPGIKLQQKNKEIYANWISQKSTFESKILMNIDFTIPQVYIIRKTSVLLPQPQTITATLAAQMVQQYFIDAPHKTSWDCQNNKTMITCEIFSRNNKQAKGYGLFQPLGNLQYPIIVLFTCTIPATSQLYTTSTSCSNL